VRSRDEIACAGLLVLALDVALDGFEGALLHEWWRRIADG